MTPIRTGSLAVLPPSTIMRFSTNEWLDRPYALAAAFAAIRAGLVIVRRQRVQTLTRFI